MGTIVAQSGHGGKPRSRPAHLILTQDGEKLTGTGGPNESNRSPIQNGKVANGTLTFELGDGNSVMKFTLKLEGDEITGDVTRERNGAMQTAKLAVKRAK